MRRIRLVAACAVSIASVPILAVSCRHEEPAENRAAAVLPPSPVPRAVPPLPDEAFRVEWVANTVPKVMKAGATYSVSATFRNGSRVPWPDRASSGYQPPGAGAVRLAYRWWPGSSPSPEPWGPSRGDLGQPLQPGQSATVSVVVRAPAASGDYRLQFDLLQELVVWFESKNAARLLIPVRVQ
jgi:hypothetical protein